MPRPLERHLDDLLDHRRARAHDDDPVGEVRGLGEAVRHEHDGLVLLLQQGDQLPSEAQAGLLVERGEGFVEQQDRREGDEWVAYVVLDTYSEDVPRDRLRGASPMATECP